MDHFLICENPKCRFVLDLHEGRNVVSRSDILLSECPECGRPWSNHCPFCIQPLGVAWRGELPHCSNCRRKLQAEAA
jgi:hypothetical protein